jgi:Ankyrin repeat
VQIIIKHIGVTNESPSPLHFAAMTGNTAVVELLVKGGYDVNAAVLEKIHI